ncbi:hypothetical protein BDW68DRAFT_182345 [Aspergillus falconensis]
MLISTVAIYLARFISFMAVITGPNWFINYKRALQIFGLPPTLTTNEMATLCPAVGGRNMSLGTVVIFASYQLSRQQTGLIMAIIATGSGLSDTEVCLRVGRGHKRHLANLVFCYCVAAVLLLS